MQQPGIFAARLALVLASSLGACTRSEASGPRGPSGPAATRVRLQTLVTVPVRDTTEYVAELKSRQSIVLQPQVDAQVAHIYAHSGDVVEAGTVLMQLDSAQQRASLASAEASFAARRIAVGYARQQADRVAQLHAHGVSSTQEFDQTRANFQGAQADTDALAAQIRQSRVQLGYYRIVAPARGVVGDIPVHVGDYVTPATSLTTLDASGPLEAYVYVPVERAGALRNGLEVQLVDAAGASVAAADVTFVSPRVSEETQSVLVKATLRSAPAAGLRAAQFVRAHVVWSTHPAVTVPVLAVTRLNGLTFVYVAEARGGRLIAHQRPVQLGEIDDGAFVVLGGLNAGDRAIVAGVQGLTDGAPVVEAH